MGGYIRLTGTPILVLGVIVAALLIPQHYASADSYLIGVQDSQACITLIKNHLPNHCLPYDKLKPIDTTNPAIAGKWVNDTYYHRLKPQVIDHYRFTNNNWVVMVDPNGDFSARAKMITVTGDNFTWINPDDVVTDNKQRIEHVNRFVSASCDQATVAPIFSLVQDTVNYLENGCKYSSYNDTRVYQVPQAKTALINPYSSLHQDHYLKSIFGGHSFFSEKLMNGGLGPGNLINNNKGNNLKDPFSNWKH